MWVYPRVGGGARCAQDECELGGSIPAWAGEPGTCHKGPSVGKVYPRVGGGAPDIIAQLARVTGLSPRGRGSPCERTTSRSFAGSIPAWAGEPANYFAEHYRAGVYPRVGGGAASVQADQSECSGLSPRGRGSPETWRIRRADRGSIPAWAGEPPRCTPRSAPVWVYPRVGGGAVAVHNLLSGEWGLSPRGRGSPGRPFTMIGAHGSIPAWAGEPPLEST